MDTSAVLSSTIPEKDLLERTRRWGVYTALLFMVLFFFPALECEQKDILVWFTGLVDVVILGKSKDF